MPDIDIAGIFIAFIVLLFSLTVHEAAHAWTADRLGDPTARLLGRVSLNPMVHADLIGTIVFPLIAMVSSVPLLGWAKPVPVNVARLGHPRRDFVLVAAAGPLSNLVIALVAAVVWRVLTGVPQTGDGPQIATPLLLIASLALTLNVMLAVFNMIPIPPLDGGNVLSGLLPRPLAATYNALIRPYGFIILYALMLSGALVYIVGPPAGFLMSVLRGSRY